MSHRNVIAALLALLLAGCGGIASPDLATGQVSGRLTGAKPGAFVYALGKPETKVPVADDGSYTVNGVPVGSSQLVLFDGASGADYVTAEVKPASRSRADDVDASALRPARSVAASAVCSYGISTAKVTYDVEGVALRDDQPGAQSVLFPVPPGVFTVRAQAAGMRTVEKSVDLTGAATATFDAQMEVEDTSSQKGCISNSCTGDLLCGDDGRCYACTSDAQCGTGFFCHDHQCVSSSGSGEGRSACLACAADSDCASGPAGSAQPGMCIAGATGNVCSHGCNPSLNGSDCPAGLACATASNGKSACVAAPTCDAVLAEFGAFCTDDDQCAPLADPKCVGKGSAAAYCSSRCYVNADCPTTTLGAFTCDPVNRVCVKP